jgi:hypothetical protein
MNEEPKYHVEVSNRARDMLFEHAMFLAQVSVKAAEELYDQFEKNIISLEDMPERCTFYNNPYVRPGKYRGLALGKYLLILFQITGTMVYIDLIIDIRAENMNLS